MKKLICAACVMLLTLLALPVVDAMDAGEFGSKLTPKGGASDQRKLYAKVQRKVDFNFGGPLLPVEPNARELALFDLIWQSGLSMKSLCRSVDDAIDEDMISILDTSRLMQVEEMILRGAVYVYLAKDKVKTKFGTVLDLSNVRGTWAKLTDESVSWALKEIETYLGNLDLLGSKGLVKK